MEIYAGKKNRRRRSREEWAVLVEESEQSKLSLREFCAEHDIYESGIYKWRRRLRSEKTKLKTPRLQKQPSADKSNFVQVRAVDDIMGDASAQHQALQPQRISSQFILYGHGGIKIEFPSGCTGEELKFIAAALSC